MRSAYGRSTRPFPGIAVTTTLAIAVTLGTSPPPEEITQLFDEVNSPYWVDPTHEPAP